MIQKIYFIPDGLENIIDELIVIEIEKFLAKQIEVPVTQNPVFQTTVNNYLVKNGMEEKYKIDISANS